MRFAQLLRDRLRFPLKIIKSLVAGLPLAASLNEIYKAFIALFVSNKRKQSDWSLLHARNLIPRPVKTEIQVNYLHSQNFKERGVWAKKTNFEVHKDRFLSMLNIVGLHSKNVIVSTRFLLTDVFQMDIKLTHIDNTGGVVAGVCLALRQLPPGSTTSFPLGLFKAETRWNG